MNKKKYIIITGANGYLSKFFSLKICHSYNLILWDIKFDKHFINKLNKKSKDYKSKIIFQTTDITNRQNICNNLSELSDLNIYGLINCASLNPQPNVQYPDYFKNYEDFINVWNKELDISLKGYMSCIYEVSKVMSKFKNGTIINFSSDLGIISPNQNIYNKSSPKPIVYSISKHGIIGMSKYFSTLFSSKGIRVNSLCLGGVFNKKFDKKFLSQFSKLVPIGRMSDLEEIISPILFLLDEKNTYMTGHSLVIDGGRTIW